MPQKDIWIETLGNSSSSKFSPHNIIHITELWFRTCTNPNSCETVPLTAINTIKDS